jgi:hypothetical protein
MDIQANRSGKKLGHLIPWRDGMLCCLFFAPFPVNERGPAKTRKTPNARRCSSFSFTLSTSRAVTKFASFEAKHSASLALSLCMGRQVSAWKEPSELVPALEGHIMPISSASLPVQHQ